jgi:hypothetical protein
MSAYKIPSEVIQVLTGRDLDREVQAADPARRALLAADIEAGRVIVERPTARQARQLTQASSFYQYAARRLSPLERTAARIGRLNLATKARERQPVSDGKVDKLIKEIGADRFMTTLDRLTRPTAIAAE